MDKIIKRYNRFAFFYDFLEGPIEKKLFKNWRKNIISSLKGQVLEIGVGTGKNLKYYSSQAHCTAIDFSPKMLKRAKKKLLKLNRPDIQLLEMDAQNLSFADNSFDAIVTTFVWCSVPDPVKGLKEARRVLKPKGQAYFLEHVLSRNKLLALWQSIHNPLTKFLFGFNVNRQTRQNIIWAGWQIKEDKKLALGDVFRLFRVKK